MAIKTSSRRQPQEAAVDQLEDLTQYKPPIGEDLRPSLKELIATYRGEWVTINGKYGQFRGITPAPFHRQEFESGSGDYDDSSDQPPFEVHQGSQAQHLDENGLAGFEQKLAGPVFHAYAPSFNWDEEQATIPGLRAPSSPYVSPAALFSFSVEVVSLAVEAGFVEPISGTVSLYHKERREKISEDFHFSFSPDGWAKGPLDQQLRVLFTLAKPSAAVCLLIQLERTATEEDGVKATIYSKKEMTPLSERDAARLATWAASTPLKEPLAWTFIPIFDKSITNGLGGFGLDSSQPPTPLTTTPRTPLNGFTGYGSGNNSAYGTPRGSAAGLGAAAAAAASPSFSGTPPKRRKTAGEGVTWQAVQVDVPVFSRVTAPYTEDSLQDQKKAQKSVRASMRLLIQRLSGPSSTGTRKTAPALESGTGTPLSLRSAAHSHRVNGPSPFATLDAGDVAHMVHVTEDRLLEGGEIEREVRPTELRTTEMQTTEMRKTERKRRESASSARTVLDGPESGQTTPLQGPEEWPERANEIASRGTDAEQPASNGHALETAQLETARVESDDSPLGPPSSVDTEEWTVVERSGTPDRGLHGLPGASIVELFLNLDDRGGRSRGGPVRALDFRALDSGGPYTELIHLLYVYPLSIHVSKKRTVLVKVELRDDDSHPANAAMKAIFPKDVGGQMLHSATTQVAVNTKAPLFHDEMKLRLPTEFSPQHHLLFTFLQPTLRRKDTGGAMTVLGYSVLPLSMSTQVLRSDGCLPVVKELLPLYLNDFVKGDMQYLDEGRPIFRLRLRLCSTIHPTNDRLQTFHAEYDKHTLGAGGPPSSALLSAINHLRSIDFVTLQQYLHPTMTMLLRLVGDGGETLQVASFRALVNILTRVQQESMDGSERNRILVHFIDFAFDDWKGEMHPVYPGLCSVWRSLARSKAKGYKVGPVYEDVLSMAWVFLELITKSIALEANRAPSETPSPTIVEHEALDAAAAPVLLNADVFACIRSLFDCLLVEVGEKVKTGPAQAKRLNTSLAYFCHDLLSVIDSVQVYQLIAAYAAKNAGALPSAQHDLKLTFLRILVDHEKYVELPGRNDSGRNYLAMLLLQELLTGVAHEDLLIRDKVVRMVSAVICKHQFDEQSPDPSFREYIASLYFPLVEHALRRPALVTDQTPGLQRELLVCLLTVLEDLEAPLVAKLWEGEGQRPRALFQLLERAMELFQWAPRLTESQTGVSSPPLWTPSAHLFSEKLSPSVQRFVTSAIRNHEKATLEQSYPRQGIAHKAHLREAVAQIQTSRRTPAAAHSVEDLPPFPREKLDLWEGNLSARVSRQILHVMRLFSDHCTTAKAVPSTPLQYDSPTPPPEALLFPPLNVFLAKPQSLAVWAVFTPLFVTLLERHGETLLDPGNGRFVKEMAFCLLQAMTSSLRGIRACAAACLLVLLHVIHQHEGSLKSTLNLLSLTLSELLSSVQVLDSYAAPGEAPAEPPAASRARVGKLKEMLDELCSRDGCENLLGDAGLAPELLAGFQKQQGATGSPSPGARERRARAADAAAAPAPDGIDLHLPTVEAFASEVTPRPSVPRLLLPAPPAENARYSAGSERRESDPGDRTSEPGFFTGPSTPTPSANTPSANTPSGLTAEDSFFSISDGATPPLGTSPKADGWADVATLMLTLARALDSSVQHSVKVTQSDTWHDPSESYARMAVAYSHVLELRTLWLLNLCECHQGRQAWAEAAECALMIAGIIIQALIHRGDPVWSPGHLSLLRKLCPSLPETLDDPESRSSKISVDTALRYLQMAQRFLVKAGLFHACPELMELQLPAYKNRADYAALAKSHETLRGVYESIQEQEQDASFRDANYYRVGFYGSFFGALDRTEFVYRESSAVRLGDMIERLGSNGEPQNRIGIITDSRVVQNLPGGAAYLQITALEPVPVPTVQQAERHTDSPNRSPNRTVESAPPRHMGVSEFSFDTGFVKEGQTPGGLETQWKRHTVLSVAGSFPSLVRRLKVTRTAVSEVTPIGNAVAIVVDRTRALRTETERAVPVLTSVQRLLQGSVALQVNSGVLGVCKAFLEPTRGVQPGGSTASRSGPPDAGLEKLKAAVLEFVAVCKAAVKVHARVMGDDDQEFHVQLVQGLQGLIFEISAFIPTVLNQM